MKKNIKFKNYKGFYSIILIIIISLMILKVGKNELALVKSNTYSVLAIVITSAVGGFYSGLVILFLTVFKDIYFFYDGSLHQTANLLVSLMCNFVIVLLINYMKAKIEFYSKELSQNNKWYQNILRVLPEEISIIENSKVVFVNKKNETSAFKLGENFKNINENIKQKNSIESVLEGFTKTDSLKNVSYQYSMRKGNIEKYYSGKSYKIAHNNSNFIMNIVSDITSNKLYEDTLNNEIKTYKNIIDDFPNAMVIHNNNKIIYANSAALSLFHAERLISILDRELNEFIHEDSRELMRKKMKYLMEYKIKVTTSPLQKIVNCQGNIVEVSSSSTFMPYSHDSIITSFTNITENKLVQAEKKSIEEQLNKERYKTEFFGNISHELKTPINLIYSAVQTLESYLNNDIIKDQEGFIRKYLKIMKQNCYRQLKLTDNLIDITIIESGYSELKLENKNIVSILEDITLSIVDYAQQKGIELIFDTDIEEKIISFDVDKIERVVLNLLSNAIKYTDKDGVIQVTLSDKGDAISISVKDTGIGIPKEKTKEIFSRYKMLNNRSSAKLQSSGIGLSLVKSLVELHKGSIYINEGYADGCEFIINLPAVEAKTLEDVIVEDRTSDKKIEKISVEFGQIYPNS